MAKGKSNEAYFVKADNIALKTPDGVRLFDSLSFVLPPGGLLLITGPNGSGKSSLLRSILGVNSWVKGNVSNSIHPKHIAVIPQLQNMEFHLPLTLREVIEISENRNVSTESIVEYGLLSQDLLDRSWNTASGGERQRTLLTCALLKNPKLLVMDEPFNHLDHFSQKNMLERIDKYLREKGSEGAVILISHLGIDELARFGEKVVRIELRSGEK